MNATLLGEWAATVNDDDTIISGGDIALPWALNASRLADVMAMPGHKLLIRGNHDFGKKGQPVETGSKYTSLTMVIKGNPTLLLTHMPLQRVPNGYVNVHGHVHNNIPLLSGPNINICVEQLEYRPVDLDPIHRLAAALIAGVTPRGDTTAGWIEEIERTR